MKNFLYLKLLNYEFKSKSLKWIYDNIIEDNSIQQNIKIDIDNQIILDDIIKEENELSSVIRVLKILVKKYNLNPMKIVDNMNTENIKKYEDMRIEKISNDNVYKFTIGCSFFYFGDKSTIDIFNLKEFKNGLLICS